MKKILAAFLLVFPLSAPVYARLLPTTNTLAQSTPDAWSVYGGGCPQSATGSSITGCEVAVDYNGNFVPTVTGVQSLGSSALAWLSAFITNLTVSGVFTPPSLTTTQVKASTPTAAGQIIYNSTLKEVCVSTGTTIEGYSLAGSVAACQ